MRALRLVIALCAVLPCLSAHAQPAGPSWSLGQLMASLGQVKSSMGHFTERKTLHMLSEPLIASGTLRYVAPDQVQKITVSPRPERLAISGDTLTIEGGQEDRSRTVSLSDYPEIGGIVEGVRATLAGDLPTLRRFYDARLEGNAADWRLILQPSDSKLARFVKWIRISGTGNKIRVVETEDGDGDHSEMRITEDAP